MRWFHRAGEVISFGDGAAAPPSPPLVCGPAAASVRPSDYPNANVVREQAAFWLEDTAVNMGLTDGRGKWRDVTFPLGRG